MSCIQIEHEEPVDSNIIVADASPLSPYDSHSVSDQSKILQESDCYKESNVCGDGDLHLNVDQLVKKCLDHMLFILYFSASILDFVLSYVFFYLFLLSRKQGIFLALKLLIQHTRMLLLLVQLNGNL